MSSAGRKELSISAIVVSLVVSVAALSPKQLYSADLTGRELVSMCKALEQRRAALYDISVELGYTYFDPKAQAWGNDSSSMTFIRKGEKVRWEETTQHEGTRTNTIHLDDGRDFWLYQTRPDIVVSANRQPSGSFPPPVIEWLGTVHPHPSTTADSFKSEIVFEVLRNESVESLSGWTVQRSDSVFNFRKENSAGIIQEIQFSSTGDTAGELLKYSIEGKSGSYQLRNEVTTEPKLWLVGGKSVLFPSAVEYAGYENGVRTGGIRVEVLSVNEAPQDNALFSISSLNLPIGHRVNDLVEENVGHWDGKDIMYTHTVSTEPSSRGKLALIGLGILSVIVGAILVYRRIH